MSDSNDFYSDILKVLTATLVTTLVVGALIEITENAIVEYRGTTKDTEGAPHLGYELKSSNVNELLLHKNEWGDDFWEYVDSYVRSQTDGELYVKSVNITSGWNKKGFGGGDMMHLSKSNSTPSMLLDLGLGIVGAGATTLSIHTQGAEKTELYLRIVNHLSNLLPKISNFFKERGLLQ